MNGTPSTNPNRPVRAVPLPRRCVWPHRSDRRRGAPHRRDHPDRPRTVLARSALARCRPRPPRLPRRHRHRAVAPRPRASLGAARRRAGRPPAQHRGGGGAVRVAGHRRGRRSSSTAPPCSSPRCEAPAGARSPPSPTCSCTATTRSDAPCSDRSTSASANGPASGILSDRQPEMTTIPTDHPLAVAATEAIHAGEVADLERLLDADPELATARLGGGREGGHCEGMTRTLLHVATDWPGHYPNGAAVVGVLVAAGADVNARFAGPHTETPLHWAASSDDVDEAFWAACQGGQREAAEYLLNRGADRDWIGYDGLTPLDVARRSGARDVADWLEDEGAASAQGSS